MSPKCQGPLTANICFMLVGQQLARLILPGFGGQAGLQALRWVHLCPAYIHCDTQQPAGHAFLWWILATQELSGNP